LFACEGAVQMWDTNVRVGFSIGSWIMNESVSFSHEWIGMDWM